MHKNWRQLNGTQIGHMNLKEKLKTHKLCKLTEMTHEDEDTIEGVKKLLIPLIGFLKEELMFAQIVTLLKLDFIQIFHWLSGNFIKEEDRFWFWCSKVKKIMKME